MTQELVHLNWKKLEGFALDAFKNLWRNKDFVDVTLVCADGKQIKAHKVILSACSPFFKTILQLNDHQNPLIYLKGIDYKYLHPLMKFIYSGEIDIEKDNLSHFLDTANDLQISGLTRALETPETDVKEKYIKASQTISNSGRFENQCIDAETDTKVRTDIWNALTLDNSSGGHFCDKCDTEETTAMALVKHRKEKHPGMGYCCNICGKEFTRHHKLRVHKQAIHDNIKFSCDHCEKSFNAEYYLTLHKKRHTDGNILMVRTLLSTKKS